MALKSNCIPKTNELVATYTQVGIFRLTNNNPHFDVEVERLRVALHSSDITCKVDSSSGTIGRRYARADEVGIPFGLTIDFDTLQDSSVTLRDRDSMGQVRIPTSAAPLVLTRLCADPLSAHHLSWQQLVNKYPIFVYDGGDEGEGEEKDSKADGVQPAAVSIEKTSRSTFSRPNYLK
jgi:hypothetical protein